MKMLGLAAVVSTLLVLCGLTCPATADDDDFSPDRLFGGLHGYAGWGTGAGDSQERGGWGIRRSPYTPYNFWGSNRGYPGAYNSGYQRANPWHSGYGHQRLSPGGGWGRPGLGASFNIPGTGGESQDSSEEVGNIHSHGIRAHQDDASAKDAASGPNVHSVWNAGGRGDSSERSDGGPVMHNVWNTGSYGRDSGDSAEGSNQGPVVRNIWGTRGGESSAELSQESAGGGSSSFTGSSNSRNCQQVTDVVVLVDMSDSIGLEAVQKVQLSLDTLLVNLKISPTGRHMAILAYSSGLFLESDLSGDTVLLRSIIRRLHLEKGSPDSALAMRKMITLMRRQGRPGVPKACILLTDENSSDRTAAALQVALARRLGIQMLVVAMGLSHGLDLEELQELAEDSHHLLLAQTFGDLPSIMGLVISTMCPDQSSSATADTSPTNNPVQGSSSGSTLLTSLMPGSAAQSNLSSAETSNSSVHPNTPHALPLSASITRNRRSAARRLLALADPSPSESVNLPAPPYPTPPLLFVPTPKVSPNSPGFLTPSLPTNAPQRTPSLPSLNIPTLSPATIVGSQVATTLPQSRITTLSPASTTAVNTPNLLPGNPTNAPQNTPGFQTFNFPTLAPRTLIGSLPTSTLPPSRVTTSSPDSTTAVNTPILIPKNPTNAPQNTPGFPTFNIPTLAPGTMIGSLPTPTLPPSGISTPNPDSTTAINTPTIIPSNPTSAPGFQTFNIPTLAPRTLIGSVTTPTLPPSGFTTSSPASTTAVNTPIIIPSNPTNAPPNTPGFQTFNIPTLAPRTLIGSVTTPTPPSSGITTSRPASTTAVNTPILIPGNPTNAPQNTPGFQTFNIPTLSPGTLIGSLPTSALPQSGITTSNPVSTTAVKTPILTPSNPTNAPQNTPGFQTFNIPTLAPGTLIGSVTTPTLPPSGITISNPVSTTTVNTPILTPKNPTNIPQNIPGFPTFNIPTLAPGTMIGSLPTPTLPPSRISTPNPDSTTAINTPTIIPSNPTRAPGFQTFNIPTLAPRTLIGSVTTPTLPPSGITTSRPASSSTVNTPILISWNPTNAPQKTPGFQTFNIPTLSPGTLIGSLPTSALPPSGITTSNPDSTTTVNTPILIPKNPTNIPQNTPGFPTFNIPTLAPGTMIGSLPTPTLPPSRISTPNPDSTTAINTPTIIPSNPTRAPGFQTFNIPTLAPRTLIGSVPTPTLPPSGITTSSPAFTTAVNTPILIPGNPTNAPQNTPGFQTFNIPTLAPGTLIGSLPTSALPPSGITSSNPVSTTAVKTPILIPGNPTNAPQNTPGFQTFNIPTRAPGTLIGSLPTSALPPSGITSSNPVSTTAVKTPILIPGNPTNAPQNTPGFQTFNIPTRAPGTLIGSLPTSALPPSGITTSNPVSTTAVKTPILIPGNPTNAPQNTPGFQTFNIPTRAPGTLIGSLPTSALPPSGITTSSPASTTAVNTPTIIPSNPTNAPQNTPGLKTFNIPTLSPGTLPTPTLPPSRITTSSPDSTTAVNTPTLALTNPSNGPQNTSGSRASPTISQSVTVISSTVTTTTGNTPTPTSGTSTSGPNNTPGILTNATQPSITTFIPVTMATGNTSTPTSGTSTSGPNNTPGIPTNATQPSITTFIPVTMWTGNTSTPTSGTSTSGPNNTPGIPTNAPQSSTTTSIPVTMATGIPTNAPQSSITTSIPVTMTTGIPTNVPQSSITSSIPDTMTTSIPSNAPQPSITATIPVTMTTGIPTNAPQSSITTSIPQNTPSIATNAPQPSIATSIPVTVMTGIPTNAPQSSTTTSIPVTLTMGIATNAPQSSINTSIPVTVSTGIPTNAPQSSTTTSIPVTMTTGIPTNAPQSSTTTSIPVTMTTGIPTNAPQSSITTSIPVTMTTGTPTNAPQSSITTSIPVTVTTGIPTNTPQSSITTSIPVAMTTGIPTNAPQSSITTSILVATGNTPIPTSRISNNGSQSTQNIPTIAPQLNITASIPVTMATGNSPIPTVSQVTPTFSLPPATVSPSSGGVQPNIPTTIAGSVPTLLTRSSAGAQATPSPPQAIPTIPTTSNNLQTITPTLVTMRQQNTPSPNIPTVPQATPKPPTGNVPSPANTGGLLPSIGTQTPKSTPTYTSVTPTSPLASPATPTQSAVAAATTQPSSATSTLSSATPTQPLSATSPQPAAAAATITQSTSATLTGGNTTPPCSCGQQIQTLPYPLQPFAPFLPYNLAPGGVGMMPVVPGAVPIGYMTIPLMVPVYNIVTTCQHQIPAATSAPTSPTSPVSTPTVLPASSTSAAATPLTSTKQTISVSTSPPTTTRPLSTASATTGTSASAPSSKVTTIAPTTPQITTSTSQATTLTSQTTRPTPIVTTPIQQTTRPTPQATTPTRLTTKPTPRATTPTRLTTKPTPQATTPTTRRPVITGQPTTPARVATTSTSTTSGPGIPAICDDCVMVNGVGYKAHWAECDLFIQCQFLPDGSVTVRIKQCPHGLHWDQRVLTCVKPANAACHFDQCQQPGIQLYTSTNNCRGYWECVSGISEGKCCPPGYAFTLGGGCVPNAQCQDHCGVAPVTPHVCDKRPVSHMPLTFEQYVPGAGWQLMFCAPGTAYNQSQCGCTDLSSHTVPNVCRPELYIPFNGSVKDESGNNNYVQNEGVKVMNGAGYFDGNAALRVPRFSSTSFGDFVLIRLRYKQDLTGSAGGNQAMVANGDCLQPSAMYMAANQQGVNFSAQTTLGRGATLSVPSTTGGWKEAVMYVDRHALTGSVNGYAMQTLFQGSLDTSKCALQIGRGTGLDNFKGFMDDITVYLCRPTTF